MPRITARQAFTRARTKRLKTKAELSKQLTQQRKIFQQRLAEIRVHQSPKVDTKPSMKKITDYFKSSSQLALMPPKRALFGMEIVDGVETITLLDSDDDNNQSENDPPQQPGDHTSIGNTDIKFKIDDEIEIVEMLPPIPLRDHPVHEIDD